MDFSWKPLHTLYAVGTRWGSSLVLEWLMMLYHKPLYSQSAWKVICNRNGLNLDMLMLMKKVNVHYVFALEIVSWKILISHIGKNGHIQVVEKWTTGCNCCQEPDITQWKVLPTDYQPVSDKPESCVRITADWIKRMLQSDLVVSSLKRIFENLQTTSFKSASSHVM